MAWAPHDIAPLSLGDDFAAPATAWTEQYWGPWTPFFNEETGGGSPQTLNATPAIRTWVVPVAVLIAAVTLSATPAARTWNVPAATISAARTLAATPSSRIWNVPNAVLAAARVLSATPATRVWSVPAAALAPGGVTLAATPAVRTWNVPAATIDDGAGGTLKLRMLMGMGV